jgi:hypothetical protein
MLIDSASVSPIFFAEDFPIFEMIIAVCDITRYIVDAGVELVGEMVPDIVINYLTFWKPLGKDFRKPITHSICENGDGVRALKLMNKIKDLCGIKLNHRPNHPHLRRYSHQYLRNPRRCNSLWRNTMPR